jgi:hypothetical protein
MSGPNNPPAAQTVTAQHPPATSAARSTTSSIATTAPGDEFFGPFETLNTNGYPRLADLMGRHGEIAIFRKFGALNMLNLMSLQAELVELEDKLRDVLLENENGEDGVLLLQDFYEVRNTPRGNRQRNLMEHIRTKLREYSNTYL